MQDDSNRPDIGLDDIDRAPVSVPPSSGDISVSREDYIKAFSEVTEENSKLKIAVDRLDRKAETVRILDKLIEPYAKYAFRFMCCYCGFVGIFLIADSFEWFNRRVYSSVLEFLVGSTAVTVIGLVGMVLTGIFVGARK